MIWAAGHARPGAARMPRSRTVRGGLERQRTRIAGRVWAWWADAPRRDRPGDHAHHGDGSAAHDTVVGACPAAGTPGTDGHGTAGMRWAHDTVVGACPACESPDANRNATGTGTPHAGSVVGTCPALGTPGRISMARARARRTPGDVGGACPAAGTSGATNRPAQQRLPGDRCAPRSGRFCGLWYNQT
jgi:hypothetical protein